MAPAVLVGAFFCEEPAPRPARRERIEPVWRAALVARRHGAVLGAGKAWQGDGYDVLGLRGRRRLLLCGCRALLRQDGYFLSGPGLTFSVTAFAHFSAMAALPSAIVIFPL